MPTHSLAFILLCWKMSRRGEERRSDAYCRSSCDLRSSGGLSDGGCVEGCLASGREAWVICSRDTAGVIADTVAYGR